MNIGNNFTPPPAANGNIAFRGVTIGKKGETAETFVQKMTEGIPTQDTKQLGNDLECVQRAVLYTSDYLKTLPGNYNVDISNHATNDGTKVKTLEVKSDDLGKEQEPLAIYPIAINGQVTHNVGEINKNILDADVAGIKSQVDDSAYLKGIRAKDEEKAQQKASEKHQIEVKKTIKDAETDLFLFTPLPRA